MWLNCFNRIESESYVFNLGTEYDFLCVVSLNIQHYFYVYSPIVKKVRKIEALIYGQFTAKN